MFERYTEKARRVIFHARYEAIQYGSPYIETEHLLLGLLREAREIVQFLPHNSDESIRNQIDAMTISYKKLSPSVDLPLSNESKRVLAYGAEEAERLRHHHIGTEHLLLGLLRENASFGATMLRERGLALDQLRDTIAKKSSPEQPAFATSQTSLRHLSRQASAGTLEIHGFSRDADYIRERVKTLGEQNFHWHKQDFRSRDIVIHQDNRGISFDLSLAEQPTKFRLAKNGWTKDYCAICRWELMESSEPQHSTAYTNGRDWVCTDCYDKFLQGPDYFATSHPDLT